MIITNKLGLPQPLVSAVSSEYHYKDKQYSVTSLLKGTCQTILERRHNDEIEQDVSDMAWLIFGSAVHKICEQAQETDEQIKETKIVVELPNGYKLSGIQDLYDDKTKTITDYKTATVWKVVFNDWEDYEKQGLLYCWLFRKIGFEADKAEIVAFLKDWTKSKTYDQSYPQCPIHVEKFKFNDIDFENIEKFIYEKFNEIIKCEKLSDCDLPECSEKERWHKNDSFAVMKENRKSAIKVCKSLEEANSIVEANGAKHYVEIRKGKDSKCEDYCTVNKWCPHYLKREGIINE